MISIGEHLTILESVDSTNNYAMARVRTGMAKHGDGFFAMAQIAGKGQRGKAWATEPGSNIIISLAIRPPGLALQQQFQFSMAMALAARDFFAFYAGDQTTIKWPNDIYWGDRKAGGILIENVVVRREAGDVRRETEDVRREDGDVRRETGDVRRETEDVRREAGDGRREAGDVRREVDSNYNRNEPGADWQWAVVGMGININQTVFSAHLNHAVSLKQVTGKHWDIIGLARELCTQVDRRFQQLQGGVSFLAEYNSHLYKKGSIHGFKKQGRVFEGRVEAVNILGELVVFTSAEEYFRFGEIEWILG